MANCLGLQSSAPAHQTKPTDRKSCRREQGSHPGRRATPLRNLAVRVHRARRSGTCEARCSLSRAGTASSVSPKLEGVHKLARPFEQLGRCRRPPHCPRTRPELRPEIEKALLKAAQPARPRQEAHRQPTSSASEKHHTGTKTHCCTPKHNTLASTHREKSRSARSSMPGEHHGEVVRVHRQAHPTNSGTNKHATQARIDGQRRCCRS